MSDLFTNLFDKLKATTARQEPSEQDRALAEDQEMIRRFGIKYLNAYNAGRQCAQYGTQPSEGLWDSWSTLEQGAFHSGYSATEQAQQQEADNDAEAEME